jgi:hypothetical protein
VFLDKFGLLRVGGKRKQRRVPGYNACPLLVHKSSAMATSIIQDLHVNLLHAGIYKIMNILRKEFWIPKLYSSVKSVITKCIDCKRLHGRPIQTNQNDYRQYRIDPEHVPFRNMIIDYIGPFSVKNRVGSVVKTYILIFSCFWSRAVNLIVCPNLNIGNFLRAIQLHIFEYGIPSLIVADNGSQIVQGFNLLQPVWNSKEVQNFLILKNIKPLKFEPYPANKSELGGAIESLVKQVKFLINHSCRKNTINDNDFDFLVQEVKMLINKWPIAYKNTLSSLGDGDHEFGCLTPEMVVRGYEIPSISILPQLNADGDPNFSLKDNAETAWEKVFHAFPKIQKIRANLHENYMPEFLGNLELQSINKPGRYKNKKHVHLNVGDLVSIKQNFTKPYQFPLGIVTKVESNDLDEIVTVSIRKSNREIIRRHVNDVILILPNALPLEEISNSEPSNIVDNSISKQNLPRKAALKCKELNKALLVNNLV